MSPTFPLRQGVTFPIIYSESHYQRVSIPSGRSASHSSAHGAPVDGLGKGWTGGRGRKLFFFRAPANQESARPVRPQSAPGGDPAITRSHAEAGGGNAESSA